MFQKNDLEQQLAEKYNRCCSKTALYYIQLKNVISATLAQRQKVWLKMCCKGAWNLPIPAHWWRQKAAVVMAKAFAATLLGKRRSVRRHRFRPLSRCDRILISAEFNRLQDKTFPIAFRFRQATLNGALCYSRPAIRWRHSARPKSYNCMDKRKTHKLRRFKFSFLQFAFT